MGQTCSPYSGVRRSLREVAFYGEVILARGKGEKGKRVTSYLYDGSSDSWVQASESGVACRRGLLKLPFTLFTTIRANTSVSTVRR